MGIATVWKSTRPIVAGVANRLPGDRIAPTEEVVSAYARAMREVDLDPAKLVIARQVHGNVACSINEATALPGIEARGAVIHQSLVCDALLTQDKGVIVGVVTADCLPVLFYDESHTAVAAAHAGWRGLAAGILDATVDQFQTAYAVPPSRLHAYIGPAICQQCFETGPEVVQAFAELLGDGALRHCLPGRGDRHQVDLSGLAVELLTRRGLPLAQIIRAEECTCCHPNAYWSHRKHGLQRGNQLSFIALR